MGRDPEGIETTQLESLGLDPTEITVYGALVERSVASSRDLGGILGVTATELARSLDSLEAKGLVSRQPGRPEHYAAVAPELGLELLLLQREEELTRTRLAVTELAERFRRARSGRDPAELVEVITGAEAVSQHHSQVHRSAQHELRVMTRPPFVQSAEDNRAVAADVHARRLRVRTILDVRQPEHRFSFIREDLAHGEEYRSMPGVPLKLVIADDSSAIIPLEIHRQGIESAVLVHSSALLEALTEVFDTCWRFAYPLDIVESGDGFSASTEPISESQRHLLALLASGVPDAAIARRLGISPSTVQRRIRVLMTQLGAATRFQAGLQAALRGWITDDSSD